MNDDLWVVFDGAEPDSAVIGLAVGLETVITVIGDTVALDYETVNIALTHSDAARVSGTAQELYTIGENPRTRRTWVATKHSVTA